MIRMMKNGEVLKSEEWGGMKFGGDIGADGVTNL